MEDIEILKIVSENQQEVLEAVKSLSEYTEARADRTDLRLEQMDKRLVRVEALMVTKDYLDDKLADLKGDLVGLLRKEDAKLGATI